MELTNLDLTLTEDILTYDTSNIVTFDAKSFYDDYKSKMSSPIEVIRDNFGDDSSTTIDIGNNFIIDMTSEGSIGFIDKTITNIRNSGYTYSRMYYANREPDYQIIMRRNLDLYCNNITISYNNDYVLVYGVFCSLSGRANPYACSTAFNRNDKTLSDIYLSSSSTDNTTMLIGYKSYNRTDIKWQPQIIIDGSKIVDDKNHIIKVERKTTTYYGKPSNYTTTLVFNNKDTNDYEFGFKNKNIEYNYFTQGKLKNNFSKINPQVVYLTKFSLIDNLTTKINFFVEGTNTDQVVYIDGNSYTAEANMVSHIYVPRFKSYTLSSGEYKLILNETTNMVRGYINGKISIDTSCYKSTQFNKNELYIKCVRASDYSFIGNYKIKDSAYYIPNLDVVRKYNLILIDPSGTLEPQVISDRRPTAYNELDYKIPNIVNQNIVLDKTKILIKAGVDDQKLYGNIKKIRLYYSNEKFTKETVGNVIYQELDGLKVSLNVDTKYNYYMLSVIGSLDEHFGTLIDISTVSEITTNIIGIEND